VMRLTMKRRHIFERGQLRSAARMIAASARLWPFLATLVRRHSLMPAARIASTAAFYMRFVQLLRDNPELAAVMVASNYSPEALGLAAAAHHTGRSVIYINHAPVPANCATVPPVFSDCAVFYGEAVRQTYQRRSDCAAQVALIGQPWVARPLEWRNEVRQVGIFLTALTRAAEVEALAEQISRIHPGARILIRNHPVALLKGNFSALGERFDQLEVTIGNPLDDEIAACDLVFCGNSGVAMNVLRGGRPVAYLAALDRLTFDYNGFVAAGLVCDVSGWSADLYQRLKSFYSRPEWHAVMRSYDASYGIDAGDLERAAGDMVRAHVMLGSCRN
jgi:hypothetical protein